MAFKHGKNSQVHLDDSSNVLTEISSKVQSWEFPDEADTEESTTIADDSKQFVTGMLSGHSYTITAQLDDSLWSQLTGLLNDRDTLRGVRLQPFGAVSGAPQIDHEAVITGVSFSGGRDGLVMANINVQVSGDVTYGTAS